MVVSHFPDATTTGPAAGAGFAADVGGEAYAVRDGVEDRGVETDVDVDFEVVDARVTAVVAEKFDDTEDPGASDDEESRLRACALPCACHQCQRGNDVVAAVATRTPASAHTTAANRARRARRARCVESDAARPPRRTWARHSASGDRALRGVGPLSPRFFMRIPIRDGLRDRARLELRSGCYAQGWRTTSEAKWYLGQRRRTHKTVGGVVLTLGT